MLKFYIDLDTNLKIIYFFFNFNSFN